MSLVTYFKDGREAYKRFADTAQGKKNEKQWLEKMETAGRRARRSTPKSKEEVARDQDYDQKEIDKNKPSEAKTEKVHVLKEDEWKFKGKSSIGGHDPGLNVYQVRGD
jgi:hypothetical protein